MLNNNLLIYIKIRIDEMRFFYALTLLELTLYVYRSIADKMICKLKLCFFLNYVFLMIIWYQMVPN